VREVDPRHFHYVMYPATTPVIAARAGGEASAMPAAWTAAVSFDPPMLMTAIAPERKTYMLIRESGYFTVNYLDFSRVEALAMIGSASSRFLPDKLERAGLRLVEARRVPSVALADAAAVIECSLRGVVDVGGDHDVVVGRVEAVLASEDFKDGAWSLERYRPILYMGRTRGPGPSKFRFATTGEVRDVEYGAGVRQAVEERRRARKLVEGAVDELARKTGRSPEDVAYVLLDALKGILARRWRG
jgi:flavin reductase (DIM6/NTAB) family NADH-FMN oxidoreductase RutF